MNNVVTLTPKGAQKFQVIVCLTKSMIELKSYLRVNPNGLRLSDDELAYAKQHGLDGLVANGLVEIKELGADAPPPKPIEAKNLEPVKEEKPTRLERGQTRKMREAVKPPSMLEPVAEPVIEPVQKATKPDHAAQSELPKTEE